jgi:hypothetical protein
MSKKRWNVSVDLVTLGQITELHSGPYANDWWLNHGGVVNENSSYLYPIRVGQQTRVVVKEMPFTLTVFVHKEGDHCVPAYRCDSRNYVGEKKSSATAAFESTYRDCCGAGTRISGATLLGLDDEAICFELVEDLVFHPFTFLIANRLRVSVYQLGDLNKTKKNEPGFGFLSSFLHYFRQKRCLFIQSFDDKGYHIQICDGPTCVAQFNGPDATTVWEQTGILTQHDGNLLFGLENATTKEVLSQDRSPKCTPDDWIDSEIMEQAYNYYVKRRTISNIAWRSFFAEWREEQTIIELWSTLAKFYPHNYGLTVREKRAWRAMLSGVGCTNVTPFSRMVSQVIK